MREAERLCKTVSTWERRRLVCSLCLPQLQLKGASDLTDLQQPTIVTGASVEVEALREGFNRGFSDYPYNLQMDASAMPVYLASSSIAVEDCAVLMAEEQGRLHGVGVSLLGGARRRRLVRRSQCRAAISGSRLGHAAHGAAQAPRSGAGCSPCPA